MCNNDKFDNLSSPIVALRQFFAPLTDQTTNSIFDSFRTDIGDRQASVDEVARWKTRWNMVDGQKPQTLLETLNVTNQDLYPNIYAFFTLITMSVKE
jgi:hypothetical protein